MADGKRWTVQDRNGNEIYLTDERWLHITDPLNHPEMNDYEEELKETLQTGTRKQDGLNPRKYRYSKRFDRLVEDNTHIVAITLFAFVTNESGKIVSNNYVATAYQKEVLNDD